MKNNKVFEVLQRVGRSFMLPIAILPVAGLFLGMGSSFTNETMLKAYGLYGIMGPGTIIHGILTVMSAAGSIVFDNLPLLFAIGVAIGMAKREKEVAALASVIAFFIMHTAISALISVNYAGGDMSMDAMEQAVVNLEQNLGLSGATSMVLGIYTLNMGAVSYTHLDVYKRQTVFGLGGTSPFWLGGTSSIGFCILSFCRGLWSGRINSIALSSFCDMLLFTF